MASLIDTLIDVLGQEDAEYKKLLELSNNKTKAIVGADIERLQDILVQEQAQIDAINKLEQQRMENVDDICNVLNLRRTDIKLEDILEEDIIYFSICYDLCTILLHLFLLQIQFCVQLL